MFFMLMIKINACDNNRLEIFVMIIFCLISITYLYNLKIEQVNNFDSVNCLIVKTNFFMNFPINY